MERKGTWGAALAVWLLVVLAGAAWGGARLASWSGGTAALAHHDDGHDRGRGGGGGNGRGTGGTDGGSTDGATGGGSTDGATDGTTGATTDGGEGGPTSVGEQHDFVVMMGEVDPWVRDWHAKEKPGEPVSGPATASRADRFEYLAFYPERLTVHAGDVVELRRAGFHTLMFVDDVANAPGFLRRDELEGVSSFFGRNATDPGCAVATSEDGGFEVPGGTPACVLDQDPAGWTTGTNSALIEIQLPPGTYPFVCTVHAGMTGALEVVPDDIPVWTPEEVAAQHAAAYAADTAAAEQVIHAGKRPTVEADGDVRVWTVKAGDWTADGRVAVTRFLPSDLTIAEGDEIRYVVPDAPGGIDLHTVSFPDDAFPFGFLTYLAPTCDPDDEETGAPGVPLLYAAFFTGCPPGWVLDIQFHPWAWRAPLRAVDDRVATPKTVHDSGFLMPANHELRYRSDPWTGEPFPSSSHTRFGGPGVYGFQCNVHPEYGMVGSITVVAATP